MHIGVIADDFTGGLDAAGFIKKSGENVTLFNGLPGEGDLDAVGKDDSAVIAMQIRSIDRKIASDEAEKAALLLKKAGARMIYFKYCSTFDSTEKGNIGPIIERLMKVLSVTSTILVPSLPVNGRTVKDGILYVNGVELSSSPMRYHPLNPMTISYIPEILRRQSSPDLPIHLILPLRFNLFTVKSVAGGTVTLYKPFYLFNLGQFFPGCNFACVYSFYLFYSHIFCGVCIVYDNCNTVHGNCCACQLGCFAFFQFA